MKKTLVIALAVVAAGSSAALADKYLVKEGDWISKVAKSHGHTVQSLLDLNPQVKNSNLIYPGDYLELGDGDSSAKKEVAAAAAPVAREKEVVYNDNDNDNDTGLYIAGRAGISMFDNNMNTAGHVNKHFEDMGGSYKFATGYDFGSTRIEAEYGYANGYDREVVSGTDLRAQAHSVFANLFYDIDLGAKVTPFINVGAGFVNIREKSTGVTSADYEQNLGLSAGAGFSWKMSSSLIGELSYRFSDFGHIHDDMGGKHSYDLHEALFGLRYQF